MNLGFFNCPNKQMDGADIGAAAIGAVFGSLLEIVKEVAITTYLFKYKLKLIEKTLISLKPKINSIAESKLDLNSSNQETAMLVDRLKAGKKLVLKCSKIKPWDLPRKFIYSMKLKRFQKQLLWFFQVDVQIQLTCESKRTLVEVGNLNDKMDLILIKATPSIPSITPTPNNRASSPPNIKPTS